MVTPISNEKRGRFVVRRPGRQDAMDLAPAFAVLLVWYFMTDRSSRSTKTMLIPALFGVVLWAIVKGVRYVPAG